MMLVLWCTATFATANSNDFQAKKTTDASNQVFLQFNRNPIGVTREIEEQTLVDLIGSETSLRARWAKRRANRRRPIYYTDY